MMIAAPERRASSAQASFRSSSKAEFLAITAVAMAAAAMSFYQSGRLVPLVDWSWTTENSYRIARGQRPFIELGMATAPGTYVLQALLIRLFGVSAYVQRVYACVGAAVSVVATVAILRHLGIGRLLRILLGIPLAFGVYVVYAYPNYDNDAMLTMLLALWWLLWTRERSYRAWQMFAAGVALSLPFFFKQNIGGVMVACILLGLAILTVCGYGPRWSQWAWAVLGCTLLPAGVLVWLYAATGIEGLRSYWFWTFVNAARAHPVEPGRIIREYQWPACFATAIYWLAAIILLKVASRRHQLATPLVGALLALPILYFVYRYEFAGILLIWPPLLLVSTVAVIVNGYQRSGPALFRALLLVSLVAIVNAAFISQGILGSTYGHWPIVSLLLGLLMLSLRDQIPEVKPVALLLPVIMCWTVGLGLYVSSNLRLDYIPRYRGAPVQATHPVLRGMSTPGPWLPLFEELVAFTNANIPFDDKVIAIPGEDPFYSTTGRMPQLSLFQVNDVTFPHEPAWMAEQTVSHDVRWIIIKKRLQMPNGFRRLDPEFFRALDKYYEVTWESPWYRILRRRDVSRGPTTTNSAERGGRS
jgi:hypothetical protein